MAVTSSSCCVTCKSRTFVLARSPKLCCVSCLGKIGDRRSRRAAAISIQCRARCLLSKRERSRRIRLAEERKRVRANRTVVSRVPRLVPPFGFRSMFAKTKLGPPFRVALSTDSPRPCTIMSPRVLLFHTELDSDPVTANADGLMSTTRPF